MATTTSDTTLQITRTINAPQQKVYEAWLDPDVRRNWWSAAEGMACDLCEIDARVGGTYRINMKKDGNEWICSGTFRELIEPRKIVMTWGWDKHCNDDASMVAKNTLLTIELEAAGDGATKLTLTHEQFDNAAQRDDHSKGWAGCLASLAAAMEG